MQAAVVPDVSSSWQVKNVPQPEPGPNQVKYPLAEAPKAYDRVAQGKARFRAVLTM